MIYAVFFGFAILAGWVVSARHVSGGSSLDVLRKGNAELSTMCILTSVWLGTLWTDWFFEDPTPLLEYILMDAAAVYWLLKKQSKNWQWITVAVFAVMFLSHLVFIVGMYSGNLVDFPRPWKDILAVLGYIQILNVILMARQRRLHHGGAYYSWAGRSDWVLVRSKGRVHHEVSI